jgi:hypothetical protein
MGNAFEGQEGFLSQSLGENGGDAKKMLSNPLMRGVLYSKGILEAFHILGLALLNSDVTPVTPIRLSEVPLPEPRRYLIEDLIPKAHTTTIFGDSESAKSILALSAAIAVAGGAEKWMGCKVESCTVHYGDFELDADEQRRRACQVSRGVFLEKPPHDLL